MRFNCLLLALISSVCCYAQNWQSHYQLAREAYQQEQYGTAVTEAEQAIKLCGEDVKGQAFSRQIFTAACLASEQYTKGLSEIAAEIQNFGALEPAGDNYLEAVHKKGQLEMGVGKFEQAAATFQKLASLHADRSGKSSYEFLVAQAEQADALMQAKKYTEAQQAYEPSIAGFRAIPDAGEDYLYALFNSAFIDFTISNKAAASGKLSQLIQFMEANDLKAYPEYEQAREMLSKLNVSGDVASTGLVLPADKAQQLFEQAFALQDRDVAQAIDRYQASIGIISEHKLVNKTTFSCYLNYARLLFALGSYAESKAMVAVARQHAKQLFGEGGAPNGHVKVLLGDLALRDRDPATAITSYEEGISGLKGDATWIKQTQWVCNQLIAARESALAIRVLSIVMTDPAFRTFQVRDKITLHQLNARAHIESRQTAKLIAFLQPLTEAEKNADLKQTYLLLWAGALDESGDLNGAHRLLLDALTLAPAGPVVGEAYFQSARAYQRAGDYRNAEIHYRKALALVANSPSSAEVMPLLFNSVATFYIQLGNYDAAEELFLDLLAKESGSPDFYNAVRQNLSALYRETGRYKEAKKLLMKTIVADERRGSDRGDYAIALQNLAAIYQDMGELDSARILYEKALAIDAKQFGEQSLSYATKLANLGTVYQEADNFEGARKMFERAMEIRRVLLPADHPDFAYSQYTLANLLYRTQKPREALPLFKASAEYYIRQIHDVFPALSDYERTAFYNRVSEVISTYEMFLLENISLEKDLAATLLNFRLQTKALLLNSSLKVRNQILGSGDQELIRDFHVWQHTKEQLAYLFSLTKAEREQYAGFINDFTKRANTLEKSLSLKSESFSSAFTRTSADWHSVQGVLKPGESAVEILRVKLKGRDSVVYAALVVKPEMTEPGIAIMPNGNFLEQKGFKGYINRMRFGVNDDISYALFWKKLEPMLQDVHTIYLSPDGVYSKINCLTLYDAERKQFLIDSKKVMLVSNVHDLVAKRESRNIPPHAFLVGFPDYRMDSKGLAGGTWMRDAGSIFSTAFKDGFADLPGTETEVTKIKDMLASGKWQVETMLRRDALESRIKGAEGVTLLHIATHGFFVAAGDEHAKQVYSNDLKDIENNSMLRSGLVLAGAEKNLVEMMSGKTKTESEDGILTAYEVMNLNLDNAELVVLSACETGTGDVKNGEGVYGLQRAFLLAGARHVVMSLWKVDDAATQQLMTEFYAQWLGGKDKLEAFQEAQVAMQAKFPHPRYWGAFVIMGR